MSMPIHFNSWWNIHDSRLSHVGTHNNTIIHGSGRALFGDGGRYGNTMPLFDENNNITIKTQYNSKFSYKTIADPFYFDDGTLIYKSDFKSNTHLFIAEREVTLNKYRHLRQITNLGLRGKQIEACQNYVDSVNNHIGLPQLDNKVKCHIPISLNYAASTYSDLLTKDSIKKACQTSSSIYSGGCIKLFMLDNIKFLARCAGKSLSDLRIDRYHDDGMTLTKVYETSSDEVNPIFEIDVNVTNNECRLLLRREKELQLLHIVNHGETLSVVDLNGARKFPCGVPWHSARFNRYLSNILMMACSSELRVFDVNRMSYTWSMDVPSRVNDDPWTEVQSLLPLQWIYATRNQCAMVDSRQGPSKCPKKNFLNINHPCFSSTELFNHASEIFNVHYFYLTTSYSAVLMDVRMEGHTVNHWPLPLLTPASFSSITTHNDTVQCVLGTQMCARHCIFDQSITDNSKESSIVSTDITDHMSLGLVAVREHRNRTSVLTLDHLGRVLCHQYGPSSEDAEPRKIIVHEAEPLYVPLTPSEEDNTQTTTKEKKRRTTTKCKTFLYNYRVDFNGPSGIRLTDDAKNVQDRMLRDNEQCQSLSQ